MEIRIITQIYQPLAINENRNIVITLNTYRNCELFGSACKHVFLQSYYQTSSHVSKLSTHYTSINGGPTERMRRATHSTP